VQLGIEVDIVTELGVMYDLLYVELAEGRFGDWGF
jgi:hypothetical protein